MSMPVVRLGDSCSGHDSYSPRPSVSGSTNIFVNGIPAHRMGDAWDTHCAVSCHTGNAIAGSPTVFANSIPLCRIGDAIDCGSTMVTGSPNVFSG
jgi:uncharacterized Zn-binding protein involved in type VI secretion